METEEKTTHSPLPSQNQRKPSQLRNNHKLEESIKDLRQRGYKITEEYDTTGLSKVSGEPPLGKTSWERLQLLLQIITALALPVVLFAGAQVLNFQQTRASQDAARDQQREVALQSYLDRMSDLLLGNNTGKNSPSLAGANEFDEISQVARSRTLTVLRGLDGKRKGIVLQFLYDSRLIGWFTTGHTPPLAPIVDLSNADLSNADLASTHLSDANLSYADLDGVHLLFAHLNSAHLNSAHLRDSDITQQQVDETTTCKDTQTPTDITHSQSPCP